MDELAKTHTRIAADNLDELLTLAMHDSEDIVKSGSIPDTVKHFAELRNAVQVLAEKVSLIQKHVDGLSQEVIPTLFNNQHIKSINVLGFGKATVADRWSCSLVDKQAAMQWLRDNGQGGMIQDSVHPSTMGAYAKGEMLAGKPLPADLFKVTASPHTRIEMTSQRVLRPDVPWYGSLG